MPSKAFTVASCARASACASREVEVDSMVATAFASKLPFTTFWMVGINCVTLIAARQVLFSAFQFFAIVPSAFQLYQTGFDSASAFAYNCAEVSAAVSHGGIQAAMRYANDAGAIASGRKNARKKILDVFTFGS